MFRGLFGNYDRQPEWRGHREVKLPLIKYVDLGYLCDCFAKRLLILVSLLILR